MPTATPVPNQMLVGWPKQAWIALPSLALLGVLVWFVSANHEKPDQITRSLTPPGPMPRAVLPAVASALPGEPPPHPAQSTNDLNATLVAQMNQANQFLSQDKPQEALQVLQTAVRDNPEDEDIHYNLGIALARLGRNQEAIKEYEEALRLFPDYAEAHNNLGNVLMRTQQRGEALKHFEQAVKITPDYASAWNNSGTALEQLGRTNEAQEHFQKAVQLDTNYWQAHYNLATSLLSQNRFPEAQTEFATVLRLQPNFAPAQREMERITAKANSSLVPKPPLP
jgi:tetratricopeptide (TPR) repeat protein